MFSISRWPRFVCSLVAAGTIVGGLSVASAQSVGLSTLAGQPNSPQYADGTGGAARFNNPQGVAVDSAGNVYIADTSNHMIRKVTPAGVVTTIAGNGTAGTANGTGFTSSSNLGTARFNNPEGVAVDGAGTTLWVADTFNHTIRVVDLTASPVNVTTLAGAAATAGFADNATGSSARFNFPAAIVYDGTNLYVSDQGNQDIRKVTTAGAVTTLAGPDNTSGNAVGTAGLVNATGAAARFSNPLQLAVDSTRLFVADKGNNEIRVITLSSGAVATLAGSATAGSTDAASGPATSATFSGPGGVTVDSTGSTAATTLYVADSVNDTLRKIVLSSGAVTTIAGSAGSAAYADGLGTSARFNGPLGIALDSSGNLYVTDTLNQLVRKAAPTVAPAITSANNVTFTYATASSFTVTATGSPAATFSVTSGTLPSGITLTTNVGANTATLGGAPLTAGSFPITIQASNGIGTAATQTFTITVQQAPNITSATGTAFSVNTDGTFQVAATGFPAPTFSIFSGTLPASVATLTSAGVLTSQRPSSTAGSPFVFTIRATNTAGTNDQVFTLTIQNGAAITSQPANLSVQAGQTATFTVGAGGTPAPNSYLWYREAAGTGTFVALSDLGNYSGTTTSTLTISNTTAAMDQDQFQCVVGNGVGSSVTSQPATLRVGVGPVFTSTSAATFVVNTAGTFTVTATGTPAPTFSITSGSLPSSVATLSSSGILTAAPPSSTTGSPYTFTITATNLAGTATQNFTLYVSAAPVAATITTQPTSQTVGLGQNVTLAVGAAGNTPMAFQWQRFRTGDAAYVSLSDAGQYSGTTTATLSITGVSAEMNGDQYRCVVTNDQGSATSNSAQLTITSASVFSTIAGQVGTRGSANGTGTAAQFNSPTAVAVDSSGNLYIADTTNSTIRKIDTSGVVTTLAGLAGSAGSADGLGSAARFNGPSGIAVDSGGMLYVADSGNHIIRTVTPAGYVTTIAGSAGVLGNVDGTGTDARFAYPAGIAVDNLGFVYVADTLNNKIRKLVPAGAGVYSVIPFNLTDGSSNPVALQYPNAVAVDTSYNLYIADTRNQVIRKATSAGVTTTLAGAVALSGSADGIGTSARFNQPNGVAVDSSGNVYVADTSNDTIREITSGGVVTTIAGLAATPGSADGSGGTARFNQPYGVAVDSSGNIYIADTFNHTIRRSGSGTAPQITTQPSSVTVRATQNATFTIAATGTPTPSYQWQRQAAGTSGFVNLTNNSTYSGTNSASLTIAATTEAMSGDQFQVVVNNLVTPSPTSSVVTLTVLTANAVPTITTQPTSMTVNRGDNGTFSISASGTGTLSYQWNKDGAAINGATSASLTIPNAQSANTGFYTVTVSNSVGATTSAPAYLMVNTPPVLTTFPRTQAAIAGTTVAFSANATGAASITYQWRKNGTAIAGATNSTLTLANVSATDAANYDVVATNSLGSVTSGEAQLMVVAAATAPTFTAQPSTQTAVAGSTVNLTAAAAAAPTPTYQWRKNGAAIPGATNATLTLSNVQSADAGNYDVVVTNSAGSITSSAGALTVIARSYAGTYFGSFAGGIGTFAIYIRSDNTGVFLGYLPNATAPIVTLQFSINDSGQFTFTRGATSAVTAATDGEPARAAALASTTVTGAIAADGTVTGTISGGANAGLAGTRSADTGTTQNLAGLYLAGSSSTGANTVTIVSATGQAFAVAQAGTTTDGGTGSASSTGLIAVNTGRTSITEVVTPATGAITVSASGAVTGSFNGASEAVVAAQRLANISSRAQVSGGNSVAIAGFVISGTESKPVLIRAVGPGLATAGVSASNTLPAPKLELYRTSDNTIIASNTGVATAPNATAISAASQQVGAFAMTANDSAILMTLPPGGYTAKVSGSTGGTGLALAEVYDLSASAAGQKLVNISTRAAVGTGDNALIAGVVINGTVPKRVLIRAVGPGLAPYGLSGLLAQPVLTLMTLSGQVIAQNTGWTTSADATAITDASNQVGGFPLAVGDSALIVTLAPGGYSANVSGSGGTSGIALVEIYELQ